MYVNVALLDIASMHPSSTILEELFGEHYTRVYEELKQARIYVKHGEYDKVAEFSLKNPFIKRPKQLNKNINNSSSS